MESSRIVTLTGTGGVGKSRLALHVAEGVRRAFRDGVRLVELADLQEPSLLSLTVAGALGRHDQSSRDAESVLIDHLADKQLLLILDNCEHLVDQCARLVTMLLSTAPQLRILATSREPLCVQGEHVWQVPPLALPNREDSNRWAQDCEAVRLFEQRAAAAQPGFTVNSDNRAAVTRLCQRLDGIPLAIELAAVRTRGLAVEDILARLDDRFPLLSKGNRGGPARHHTLRSAVDYSYERCSPTQRRLWQRLSVFNGGFDLRAAEAVCAGNGVSREDVVESVAALVEKSVLIREEPIGRYRLLETIREYGQDHLRSSGDDLNLRLRHRDYYLDLAEQADTEWFGPRQVDWLRRLHTEHANVQAALDFCRIRPEQAPAGLRMATALWWYWIGHGLLSEGRHWLEQMLALDQQPSRERARALWLNGWVRQMQGEPAESLPILEECSELARHLGDDRAMAYAAQFLGSTEMFLGDWSRAATLLEEAVAQHRSVGQQNSITLLALAQLGWVKAVVGNVEGAVSCFEECRSTCEEHGERWTLSWALWNLGHTLFVQGEFDKASTHLRASLRIKRAFPDRLGIPFCVEVLAWAAAAQGHAERAARLSGAGPILWRPIGTPLFGYRDMLDRRERCVSQACDALGKRPFDVAVQRGSRFTLDEVVNYALGERSKSDAACTAASADSPLTRREREIAELVAQGHTNKNIAAKLVIARRTVDSHVEHILTKLGYTCRSQIAAWITQETAGQAG